MKTEFVAIPVFQERVSPLMDVSNKYTIFETENGEIKQKINISLNTEGELQRVEKLKELGVTTIICGAVSGCVAHIVDDKGMRLISMVYGPVEEIIEQYLSNMLTSIRPAKHGCGSRGRKPRGRCSGLAETRGRHSQKTGNYEEKISS